MRYLEAGEVILLGTERFRWIIDDFFSVAWSTNDYLQLDSPSFGFLEAQYRLKLEFCGRGGPLRLTFCSNPDYYSKLGVRLGMKTGYRGKLETRRGETYSGQFDVEVWMPSAEFWERRSEILTDGRLTISCDILFSLKKMQRDLRNLYISGEDTDVTIKVQEKEFPAHRNILRARSPVFKSMFSHEMVEKQSGVVVIDDCDSDTFPDFLNYVYTGSTKHISDENVFTLYTVSDKYGVEELKEECAAFMTSNLSVGTFCDVIPLALRHTETELIDIATAFFSANLTKIIKTVKWQTFLHENTTVGNELLIKALSTEKKCVICDSF